MLVPFLPIPTPTPTEKQKKEEYFQWLSFMIKITTGSFHHVRVIIVSKELT